MPIKALPISFVFALFDSLVILSQKKKKESKFDGDAKELKEISLDAFWGTPKFPLFSKLSTYLFWSAAIKNTHSENEKAIFASHLR